VAGFGKVIGRFGSFIVDGPDPDVYPDLIFLVGTVTFTPTVSRVINNEVSNSMILGASPITGIVNPLNGELSTPASDGKSAGAPGLWLPATDNVMFNPTNFYYRVTYNITTPDGRRIEFEAHNISVPQGTDAQPVNLNALIPPIGAPTVTVAVAEAIAARAVEALSKAVRTVNGIAPDASGNVLVSGGGSGGGAGTPGREVLIRNNGSYIQWQYSGETSWINLVLLTDLKGAKGDPGNPGSDSTVPGPSAYQVWLAAGNDGSVADYLAAIKGSKGDPGLSAYQVWLAAGNTGTQAEYLASLKGLKGDRGISGATGLASYLLPAGTTVLPAGSPVGLYFVRA